MDPSIKNKLKLSLGAEEKETPQEEKQEYNMGMLSPECIELLTYRIQQEQYSSKIYEQFSLWLDDQGLVNLAALYDKYAQEELVHAGWAKEYLLSYNLKPRLRAIDEVDSSIFYSSIQDILDLTLQHEIEVSNQCNTLATHALSENNHLLYTLASRYCKEQVEELKKSYDLLSQYKRAKDDLMFDFYIGELQG